MPVCHFIRSVRHQRVPLFFPHSERHPTPRQPVAPPHAGSFRYPGIQTPTRFRSITPPETTAILPANHRTFFISLFPTELSQSPQPLTGPHFRLNLPRMLSLVDEYHQTTRLCSAELIPAPGVDRLPYPIPITHVHKQRSVHVSTMRSGDLSPFGTPFPNDQANRQDREEGN